MPGRKTPLVTQEMYHVFNRGNNKQPTFFKPGDYKRALTTIEFYRVKNPPVSLSRYLNANKELQAAFSEQMHVSEKQVEIVAFAFMPNHFHFLLKQLSDNGISNFIGKFQNSYTKYANTKHQRDGALFLDQFKAVRIEDEDQLLHVSRYIHLNPLTSFVVKSLKDLEEFPWSSYKSYLSGENGLVKKDLILSHFKTISAYREFVSDRASYQRELEKIKHMLFEG